MNEIPPVSEEAPQKKATDVVAVVIPPWDELLEEVSLVIADTLDLERDKIQPESRFFSDLGGESIDFVTLSYSLEMKFGLRIEMDELLSQDFFQYRAEDVDRTLNSEELATIRELLPFLKIPDDAPLRARDLPDLYTVETFARFVQWRLEKKKAAQEEASLTSPEETPAG